QEVKLGILEKQDPFALPIVIENLKKEKEAKEARVGAAKAETTRLWVEQQRQAQAKQLMLKLQQEGVRFVLVSGNDRMAQIGSRVVKEGDVIEGVRVAEIRENGSVILEVVDSCDVRVRDDQPDSARR
ncbi:MAG: hypothetical protein VX438_18850, partial [Planctomycetota bacterium]|nr:hypothetical protein [Planctomycetota bacterium]